MRKLLLSVLFAAAAFGVYAQDTNDKSSKTKKTAVKGKWATGAMLDLAVTQTGSRNWAPGGDRFSLSGNAFLTLWANQSKGRNNWENTLQINYGLQSNRTFGVVKNDDKFDLVSKWRHALGANAATSKFGWGFWGGLRTQMVDGYDYDQHDGSEDTRTRISDFFAPAITAVSIGGQYGSNGFFAHIGLGGRWVIVANRPYELAAKYGVDPAREVKAEWGPFASLEYKKELIKNVHYSGRMDLASDFVAKQPGNIDVYLTNMFHLKVNKYLGVFYNFDLQYDDNTQIFGYAKNSAGTQLKSVFGVGVSVKCSK